METNKTQFLVVDNNGMLVIMNITLIKNAWHVLSFNFNFL